MHSYLKLSRYQYYCISLCLWLCACTVEPPEREQEEHRAIENFQPKIAHTDAVIAARYAPLFYQDVDTTDGWCRHQSKSGAADWITAVDYDGDWNTANNWDNLVSARNAGKLIPYVYYYVTYTQTHYFVLYSVYHPRDWTDVPFLCTLDAHENDMEAVLITAERNSDGSFGDVVNAQTKWHSDIYDYTQKELLLRNKRTAGMYIEAKGHGIRAYRGASRDMDGSYIKYYYSTAPAVSPDKNSKNLPQAVHYNLLALESTLWLQRHNPKTVKGTALVGDNGAGSNKASTPWGWEKGMLCKNPAQYLKNKYGWTNFSTTYISDTPIQ